MKRISIKEFAEQAMNLAPGASIRFSVTDEDWKTLEYVISLVRVADACCLLASSAGGGRPLAIDVTIYDSSLLNICVTLDKYINGGSGNYGYANVIESGQDAAGSTPDEPGRYMLISVNERKITTAFFPSHEKAYACMEQELYKTMDGDQEAYKLDDDYGIDDNSAWSDADNNAISDWLIVKITEDILMTGNQSDNLPAARTSVHLERHRLQNAACKHLSNLTGREITAYYDRRDYYYWGFNIADTPLNKEEIEKLFLTVGADDFDRESNDFGEYPIMEINQGLAEKMLAGELPFIMSSSHADDEGVWFFGPLENQMVNILIRYPETDMEPDIFRFALNDGTSKEALISYLHEAIRAIPKDEYDDRLSRLDAIIAYVTRKTGCKGNCLSTDYEVEIL